jgi:methionine-gamma-lyase
MRFLSPSVRFYSVQHAHCSAGGTFALLSQFFPTKMGITSTFVDIDDWDAVNAAIRSSTKVEKDGCCAGCMVVLEARQGQSLLINVSRMQVVYAETLSNPTLRMVDLPRLVEVAHARVREAVVPFCILLRH